MPGIALQISMLLWCFLALVVKMSARNSVSQKGSVKIDPVTYKNILFK